MNDSHHPWKVLAEKPIYDNPWISVTEYDVLNPAGKPGIYGKVHFKNKAIGIVPLDEWGHTYLVGQTRFALAAYSWEIPEGGGPVGTPPLDSAKRELREEAGLEAREWKLIQEMHLSNSVSDEHGYVFLATGLSMGHNEPDDTEDIHVRKVHFQEAYNMVLDGRITDSVSVIAILRVKIMLDNGEINLKP